MHNKKGIIGGVARMASIKRAMLIPWAIVLKSVSLTKNVGKIAPNAHPIL